MERIEISPAPLAQVHRTRVGRNVLICDDVQGIARELCEIDASLHLEFDPGQEMYVVFQRRALADGGMEDQLVTTWDVARNGQLDKRLVHRVRQVCSDGYDLAAELELADAEAAAAAEHEHAERVGPIAERLAHALLADLGETNSRAFIRGRR